MDEPKKFDCVEMKRTAQERILRETQGMTREQELAYWREKTETMRREQQTLQEQRKAG